MKRLKAKKDLLDKIHKARTRKARGKALAEYQRLTRDRWGGRRMSEAGLALNARRIRALTGERGQTVGEKLHGKMIKRVRTNKGGGYLMQQFYEDGYKGYVY